MGQVAKGFSRECSNRERSAVDSLCGHGRGDSRSGNNQGEGRSAVHTRPLVADIRSLVFEQVQGGKQPLTSCATAS